MDELPPFRPSRPLSIRLPAVVIDALRAQKPPQHPSLNAWVSEVLHQLVDYDRLTPAQRQDWMTAAYPAPRAGRPALPRNA